MTIFRTGKITRGGLENLCLVRNIASGGAMAQVFQSVVVDDEICLDLRLEERIMGRVVWVRGEFVGIAFSQRIDLADVLRSEPAYGQRSRAPRVSVEAIGRLQLNDVFFAVAIDNVSQTGMRIICDEPLTVGTEVRLWIDGLGPQLSFVCWTRQGIIGLAFCRPLSIRDLTTWVREQALAGQSSPSIFASRSSTEREQHTLPASDGAHLP